MLKFLENLFDGDHFFFGFLFGVCLIVWLSDAFGVFVPEEKEYESEAVYLYTPIPERQINIEDRYGEGAVEWLALNIYHEARGEPIQGQIAVAQVVLNRVYDPEFPNTVKDVIRQPYQFSWYSPYFNNSDRIDDYSAWQTSLRIARAVLNYEIMNDNTRGALYYHAESVSPKWSSFFRPTTQIGEHIFYVR